MKKNIDTANYNVFIDQEHSDFKRSHFFFLPKNVLPLIYTIFASYGLILLYLFTKTLWDSSPVFSVITGFLGMFFVTFFLGYAVTGEKLNLQTTNYSPVFYAVLWFWIILFLAPAIVVASMTLLHRVIQINLQPYLLYILDIIFPILSFFFVSIGKYSSEAHVYGDQKQFGKLMGKALRYQLLTISFALWTITLIKWLTAK